MTDPWERTDPWDATDIIDCLFEFGTSSDRMEYAVGAVLADVYVLLRPYDTLALPEDEGHVSEDPVDEVDVEKTERRASDSWL